MAKTDITYSPQNTKSRRVPLMDTELLDTSCDILSVKFYTCIEVANPCNPLTQDALGAIRIVVGANIQKNR